MAATAPLHADRGHGRTHTADHRRRANHDRHHSRVIHDHLNCTANSTTLTDTIQNRSAANEPRVMALQV